MFPLYQTSGFYYAPVSKAIVGGSALTSIALNFPFGYLRNYFRFSFDNIFEDYDIVRYLVCRCIFFDLKDLFCAGIILYHFRIFERRYGSRKFASFILCNFCLSLVLELSLVALLRTWDIDFFPVPTGPHGIIFSLYVPYFCDIPRVAYTHVAGIPVTGKSLTYIIGLQMLSGSLESVALAVLGLLSGVLYRLNIMWLQTWLHFPRFVASLADMTLGKLLRTPPPAPLSLPMGATLEIQRQQQIERLEQQMAWAQLEPQPLGGFGFNLFGNRWMQNRNVEAFDVQENNPGPAAPPPPPAEDQVQRLVEMGFNRDNVLNALQDSNNDINAATNILLREA